MYTLKIKRAYEAPAPEDGKRILVDALWPRGKSKSSEELDRWEKETAPSAVLRTSFHHHTLDWPQFEKEYLDQLNASSEAARFAREVSEDLQKGNVTLIYSSKDREHNNAVVLKNWLEDTMKKGSAG